MINFGLLMIARAMATRCCCPPDNLLGTKFLDIGTVGDNESRSFETYFKFQNVKAYDVTIVDEKADEVSSESFMTEDMTNFAVLLLLTYMIFV